MRKIKLLAAAGALMATFSLNALADDYFGYYGGGPQGFGANLNTVAAVKQHAYDDQYVTLRGRLVNYLGYDRYEFADETGTIEVELDDDYNWSYIKKGELIEILAEVDRDFMWMSLEVKRARSLENPAAGAASYAPYPGAASGFGAPAAPTTTPVAPATQAAPATPAAPAAPAAPATQAAPAVR